MSRIWDFPEVEAKPEIKEAAEHLREWLTKKESPAAAFLTGRSSRPPTSGAIPKLEKEIVSNFRPLRTGHLYLMALAAAIDYGNLLGICDLCPPRIPIILRREKSPFVPGSISMAAEARRWREGLDHYIREDKSNSYREMLGAILASAALNGGLADSTLLVTLYGQISHPFLIGGTRSFIDFSLTWRGREDMELRRFYPDPLTELLLLRLSDESLETHRVELESRAPSTQQVWRLIASFFKSVERPAGRPRNITHFLGAIQFELKTRLPVFLAAFAGREFVSHSLKSHVWERLHGVNRQLNPPIVSSVQEVEADLEVADGGEDEALFEFAWLQRIKAALKSRTKEIAKNAIDELSREFDDACDDVALLISEWAAYLLSKGSATGNQLALSTIRDYLSQIGSRVAGQCAGDDPSTYTAESLEELYQQVLEDAKSRTHRRRLARGLREFHHFLTKTRLADPINVQGVLGIGATLAPVDANLITFDEYHKILDRLDEIDLDLVHPDAPTAAKLIFILAFRCGMRRLEVLKLLIEDVHEVVPMEVLVRPHELRRLKTKSATRKLPVYALLTDDEQALLKKWKEHRVEQERGAQRSQYLFSLPEKGWACLPEETIFPLLHRVMRDVTGDDSLRFHHLRHSFANWTLLRLVLADSDAEHDLFPELPRTTAYLSSAKAFRNTLYGNDRKTRKHPCAVASILGHSGPEISLEHYMHCCDLLLSTVLAQNVLTSTPTLVKASGLDNATAYRHLSKAGTTGLLLAVRKRRKARTTVLLPTGERAARPGSRFTSTDDPSPLLDLVDRVWKLLYLRGTQDIERERLASRFGFSVAQCEMMERRADYLRSLTMPGRERSHRHRMMEFSPDKRNPGSKKRLACPHRPRLEVDKEVLMRLSDPLWELIQTDLPSVASVMDYFSESAWQTRNELVFHDAAEPEAAQRYLEFLQRLGIQKQQIRFVSYDSRPRSPLVRQWKEVLQLTSRDKVERLQSPNPESSGPLAWFGIKPLFEGSGGTTGAYGLRYLCTMVAIYISGLPSSLEADCLEVAADGEPEALICE